MTPPLGRPRSTEADEAILDAAIELFAECGYDGVAIEAVACRAGVAKSTVYRRYPGKLELLVAAAERSTPDKAVTPDTGTLEGDLFELARNLRSMLVETDLGRTIPAAIAAAARHPDVAEAHSRLIATRRRSAIELVTRAVTRGEVPPDVDADLVVDLVAGPLFYRTFVTRAPLTDDVLRALARAAVASATRLTPATDDPEAARAGGERTAGRSHSRARDGRARARA